MLKILIAIVLVVILAVGGNSYLKAKKVKESAAKLAQEIAATKTAKEGAIKAESEKVRQQELETKNGEERQRQEISNKGLNALKATLFDPESAQIKISRVRINAKIVNDPEQHIVCGTVNAKNKFGGYVGITRFAWTSGQDGLLIENQGRGIGDGYWQILCEE